ncbi:DUF4156 domain-containing protein [Pantoea ananatis]|uniref:DUF4156 domain-containing protein n=1 Tax=Pantoea ananas TaxID=553 RepID=UPI0024ACAD68|nr:DUF4156 domain-containing protein [Pantoea ananatis]MDI6539862.1 DUF4156 domain-containing protein [Pantoea ananatis]
MNKVISLLSIMMLAGCSANGLDSGAKNVRVSNVDPSGDCKFLGTVTGKQGNFITGGWTSNANLEEGALNTLRNNTADMGGNVVSLLTNRAGNTGYYYGSDGESQQTNVVITGNAWKCQ